MIGAYLVKMEAHAVHHNSNITWQSRFAKPCGAKKHNTSISLSNSFIYNSMKKSNFILTKKKGVLRLNYN